MCIVCNFGQFPALAPLLLVPPTRPSPQPPFPTCPLSLAEPGGLSTLPGLAISLFLLWNGAVWTRLRGGSSGLRWVSLPAVGLFSSRSSPASPPSVCLSIGIRDAEGGAAKI